MPLDKARSMRQERYVIFLGPTSIHVPLFFNCTDVSQAKTFALILQAFAFRRGSLSKPEVHTDITIFSKSTNGTCGFPPPSPYSEKVFGIPSRDSIEKNIDLMVQWGYLEIDTSVNSQKIFDKMSYKYQFTEVGSVAAMSLPQIQHNIDQFLAVSDPTDNQLLDNAFPLACDFFLKNNLRNLLRRLIDEACLIILRMKAYTRSLPNRAYTGCPPGRQPRNDFESLGDEKMKSLFQKYMSQALTELMHESTLHELSDEVKEEVARFIKLAKNKDQGVRRLALAGLDYIEDEAERNKAIRQKIRVELLKGIGPRDNHTFLNQDSSQF